jgi:hypothetical protein
VTDDRDDFEFLDEDMLEQDPGDPELPGTQNFPPDAPLGADDPSIDTADDVLTRELRRNVPSDDESPGFVLVTPDAEGWPDQEPQEIGLAVDATGIELSPEESALHVIEPDELDGTGDDALDA